MKIRWHPFGYFKVSTSQWRVGRCEIRGCRFITSRKPDVEIETIDSDEWNKDDVSDMNKTELLIESDKDSDVQQDTGLVNNNLRVITSNVLKSLNEMIQWTEENQNKVDYSRLLVLHNFRHVMVQMGFTN